MAGVLGALSLGLAALSLGLGAPSVGLATLSLGLGKPSVDLGALSLEGGWHSLFPCNNSLSVRQLTDTENT